MAMSRRGLVIGVPATVISPSVTGSSPAISRSRVDLPQPERPSDRDELALGDVEVDAAQRLDPARSGRRRCGTPPDSRIISGGSLPLDDHEPGKGNRRSVRYSTVRGGRLSVSVTQLRFRSATDTPGCGCWSSRTLCPRRVPSRRSRRLIPPAGTVGPTTRSG